MPTSFESVSPTVNYGKEGTVAIVALVNPPVNGLGSTTRAGIAAGIERASGDGSTAVVIVGEGKGFCGGADIREFNTPASQEGPGLAEVLKSIQELPIPVIAAINGFALGGGLELALACHYRVTDPKAQIGLPETNLGLLPGGGGTQRLPRIIDTQAALDMIISAKPVTGAKAAELGIADGTFDGDPVAGGVAFAGTLAGGDLPVVDRRDAVNADNVDWDGAHKAIRRNARNGVAQHAAIDAVRAATLPIDEGLKAERDLFLGLLAGPESKALQYNFFAEKEAPKVDDVPKGTALRTISKIGVIGAGTMGGGISMVLVNAGVPVTLIEQNQEALDKGLAKVKGNYDVSAKRGRFTAEQVDQRMGLITTSTQLEDLADVDLVIEAVFEDMPVKREIFTKLDAICKPGAILASNTSRLNIDEIAAVTKRPEDVIGLHFFSPANVMRLLEVVRGEKTAADVIATCMDLAKKVGKIPVISRVCDGFIGNRMLSPYRLQAEQMITEGALPEQVDKALTDFGLAMGPFAMSDLAGLDIGWAARKRAAEEGHADPRYKIADTLCEMGRFGQKTGAGYYKYDGRTPTPDPEVRALIEQASAESGVERREISDQEIVDRCLKALSDEGAALLAEGIAQRSSDVDVVYVNGYGFPAYRGGPMYYAENK
ncbi:MAG: 3-hydroxyacyl-CoA dehydrogenase NAD-binding domain-containing protein [Antricoccus sp.]